jgi:hypothetical protein
VISENSRVFNVIKKGNQPGGSVPPKRVVSVLPSTGNGFVTEFRHYRTGKWMRAKDYGLKAWPFGYGKRG